MKASRKMVDLVLELIERLPEEDRAECLMRFDQYRKERNYEVALEVVVALNELQSKLNSRLSI